jgi:aspartate/tyrosine/aromatic aminotransferase
VKVDESELREIATAFIGVGMQLDLARDSFKAGQPYQGSTALEIADNFYAECRNRLKVVIPDIYWGERKPNYKIPLSNIEHEERKH